MNKRNASRIAGVGSLIALALGMYGYQSTGWNAAALADGLIPGDVTGKAVGKPVYTNTSARAVAVLHPTKGSKVRGTVTFRREASGILIVARVTGLKPGKHGFHVHEKGDCSAHDAKSAGGHFNPTNMPHGSPHDSQRHAGDFGNLTADRSGKAHYNRVDTMIAFEGAKSIIGRAVIVHAKADDLRSQPSGDAGDRLACGVIGIVK